MIFMSFFQSQKQKEYIQKLEEAIQSFTGRSEALDDSKGFPFENIQELKEFGYPQLTLAKRMEDMAVPYMIFSYAKKK